VTHVDPTTLPDAEPHPVLPWLTTPRRAWLYRVLTAVGALAILYGLVSGEEAAAWLGLAVALSNVTPAAHTPTSR